VKIDMIKPIPTTLTTSRGEIRDPDSLAELDLVVAKAWEEDNNVVG